MAFLSLNGETIVTNKKLFLKKGFVSLKNLISKGFIKKRILFLETFILYFPVETENKVLFILRQFKDTKILFSFTFILK